MPKRRNPLNSSPDQLTAAQFRRHHVDKVEHNIQAQCIDWFRSQYAHLLIFAIPNGGKRDKVTAAKMKAEGVLSGMPDVGIPVVTKSYAGLYVETKTTTGRPSDEQLIIHAFLRAQGYRVDMVRNIEAFMQVVNEYLSEM